MTTRLFNNFYTVHDLEKTGTHSFKSHISLNPDHEIFKGHFPGNPITPGVCMMQIIKELTEDFYNTSLTLKSASNVKFMAIINPFETPELILDFSLDETEEGIKVKNVTTFGSTVALKLSVIFSKN